MMTKIDMNTNWFLEGLMQNPMLGEKMKENEKKNPLKPSHCFVVRLCLTIREWHDTFNSIIKGNIWLSGGTAHAVQRTQTSLTRWHMPTTFLNYIYIY
jgi:hypothetical protein